MINDFDVNRTGYHSQCCDHNERKTSLHLCVHFWNSLTKCIKDWFQTTLVLNGGKHNWPWPLPPVQLGWLWWRPYVGTLLWILFCGCPQQMHGQQTSPKLHMYPKHTKSSIRLLIRSLTGLTLNLRLGGLSTPKHQLLLKGFSYNVEYLSRHIWESRFAQRNDNFWRFIRTNCCTIAKVKTPYLYSKKTTISITGITLSNLDSEEIDLLKQRGTQLSDERQRGTTTSDRSSCTFCEQADKQMQFSFFSLRDL